MLGFSTGIIAKEIIFSCDYTRQLHKQANGESSSSRLHHESAVIIWDTVKKTFITVAHLPMKPIKPNCKEDRVSITCKSTRKENKMVISKDFRLDRVTLEMKGMRAVKQPGFELYYTYKGKCKIRKAAF